MKNPQTTLKLVDDEGELLVKTETIQAKRAKEVKSDSELHRNFRFRRIQGMKPIK